MVRARARVRARGRVRVWEAVDAGEELLEVRLDDHGVLGLGRGRGRGRGRALGLASQSSKSRVSQQVGRDAS